jgi:hypothetical protein
MKKHVITLAIMAFTMQAYANNVSIIEVNAKDVMVAQNGIIVNYENYVIPVSSISYENGKIFALTEAWMCKGCQKHHFPCVDKCSQCDDKRIKDKK